MKHFLIGILACCGLLSGCSTTSESLLAYRDTTNFTANYRADGILEISGSAVQRSETGAKVVKTELIGDTLDIVIALVPSDKKAKKDFSFKIKIEPQISTVRFGPDKEVIWQR